MDSVIFVDVENLDADVLITADIRASSAGWRLSRGRSDLLEEVLVDLDEVDRAFHLHSDPVLDHELGEQGAVDKHNARGY